jgi:hypothetical protein
VNLYAALASSGGVLSVKIYRPGLQDGINASICVFQAAPLPEQANAAVVFVDVAGSRVLTDIPKTYGAGSIVSDATPFTPPGLVMYLLRRWLRRWLQVAILPYPSCVAYAA